MTRVIGPPKSRRRHWTFLCCLAAAIGIGVIFIPGALAVHATGMFQLDGDATQTLHTNGNLGAEDWDNICASHLQSPNVDNSPGEFCHPLGTPAATTVADKSTFVTDACCSASSDNIYKGGTDDGPITADDNIPSGVNWQWKDAGPSPDKADIEQAFAAEYTCDAAHNCTNPFYSGDNILYFGGTRQADNGDTNIGFWFMRNNVTLCGSGTGVVGTCAPGDPTPTCTNANGCNFSGSHHAGNCSLATHPTPCDPGDLFIQSAFTSKPTITIYEWVGYHNADVCVTSNCDLNKVVLNPNATGDNKCTTNPADNDLGCALTNDASVGAPWFFTDKTAHSPANTFGSGSNGGELYEGGVDLTKLQFGGECIATFVLDTRSSGSSVNSTDQDFAIGHLGGCGSTLTTLAASNASGLSIGTGTVSSGTDRATVTVSGVATWSGTVNFYLCGPLASATPPAVCDANGVKLNGTVGNAGVAVNQATANGQVSSGSATLTSVGRYCWFAHFHSNTNGVPDQDEDGSGDTALTGTSDPNPECFTVSAVKASLSTSATCTHTPCVLGTDTLTDTATLGNTASEPGDNGGSYTDSVGCGTPPCPHQTTYTSINATKTGTNAGLAPADSSITWNLYGPANSSTCPAAGPTLLTTSRTVDGNGTYAKTGPPESQSPVSYKPALTDGVGTYVFLASYPGDSPNTLAADSTTCSDSHEAVTVIGSASSASDQRWLPNDRITLNTSGGTLTGTLTATLYHGTFSGTADNCTAGTATATGYSKTFTPSGDASGTTYNTDNSTFFVGTGPAGNTYSAAGTYFWLIHYHDNNLTSPNDRCETSTVSITN